MKCFFTSFCLPKSGNTAEEYEDAYHVPESGQQEEKILRFAIADGASEGMLSGKWAEILVNSFCRPGMRGLVFKDLIKEAYTQWHSWKCCYLRERENLNRPVQWYEEQGMRTGAFSSFLGLTLTENSSGTNGEWEAVAVGDSCLFQVRRESLIVRFPVEYSSGFNNRPLLISSNTAKNQNLSANTQFAAGDWYFDDCFYLMTDALACWFLQEYESGRAPWLILNDFNTIDQQQTFAEWVNELREGRQIRNDDVTLICIVV
jgi:hypothetical protein